ncbi:hypothetical protein SAMN06265338_103225 [Rhodoblastus acidophilus]|uniref:Uncharacterized protein n=1 Tax=Rhodoblastus acidophilus TaxID=1074 RepID=A0A212RB94_RHOAC|nr:hypothetical protein [Rhodoblastus acidophilus]PPQ39379.1 hypothetical protein CKO16_06390 [Rhodoblastus acidophilus]RAI19399.1 hypothetical protein CH337_12060 [Rhodoblastus acidophilus]SNB69477.1 hypothetical protein SAMN06265338_103225 [Rhodoblastus acidophilus]
MGFVNFIRNLFRRKKRGTAIKYAYAIDAIIGMSDERFALFVKDMFEREEPGVRATAALAYMRLRMIIPEAIRDARAAGSESTHEEFMSLFIDRFSKDENSLRASALFFLGYLQFRLTEMANTNIVLRSTCADLWFKMASAGIYLSKILEASSSFGMFEGVPYEIKTESDGVGFITNILVPDCYRDDERFRLLAEAHGFKIWPKLT